MSHHYFSQRPSQSRQLPPLHTPNFVCRTLKGQPSASSLQWRPTPTLPVSATILKLPAQPFTRHLLTFFLASVPPSPLLKPWCSPMIREFSASKLMRSSRLTLSRLRLNHPRLLAMSSRADTSSCSSLRQAPLPRQTFYRFWVLQSRERIRLPLRVTPQRSHQVN